jgi:hypothetical protein
LLRTLHLLNVAGAETYYLWGFRIGTRLSRKNSNLHPLHNLAILPLYTGLDGSDNHTVIEESKVEVVVPELTADDVGFAEIALLHVAPEANDQDKDKGKEIKENGFEKSSLRIRLQVPIEKKYRIGGYQDLSAEDVSVELVEYGEEESAQTILSGKIDGPDSAVSAFVYLIRQACIVVEASWVSF